LYRAIFFSRTRARIICWLLSALVASWLKLLAETSLCWIHSSLTALPASVASWLKLLKLHYVGFTEVSLLYLLQWAELWAAARDANPLTLLVGAAVVVAMYKVASGLHVPQAQG
jgi:hypothetical protein